MTEAEWHVCDNPLTLLATLNRPPADRKFQLYLVACCRQIWQELTEPASRRGVEWIEAYADGSVTSDEEYSRVEWASEGAAYKVEAQAETSRFEDWLEDSSGERDTDFLRFRGPMPPARRNPQHQRRVDAAYFANEIMTLRYAEPNDSFLIQYQRFLSISLLRDIFGNPFRSVMFSPEWRSSDVMALAQSMYTSRDFGPMPILADALEEAGCDSDDILAHCRGAGPHVRGCWVVDLVLGKS